MHAFILDRSQVSVGCSKKAIEYPAILTALHTTRVKSLV